MEQKNKIGILVLGVFLVCSHVFAQETKKGIVDQGIEFVEQGNLDKYE